MRLFDLVGSYENNFTEITQKYFNNVYKKDFNESTLKSWKYYTSLFEHKVDQNEIVGKESNYNYWIQKFIQNSNNIKEFISLVEKKNLNEKLLNLDNDVDRIFDRYFKDTIDKLKNKEFETYNDFLEYYNKQRKLATLNELIESGIIKSEEMLEVSKNNGSVLFLFNDSRKQGGNYYPNDNMVSISMNLNPVSILIKYNYDFDKLKGLIKNKYQSFLSEFEPSKIKGTIEHELAHLYDDIMHNRHIQKWSTSEHRKKSKTSHRNDTVSLTPFEIDGIVYTIKQFRRNNKDWNSYTFDDLVEKIPSMNTIASELRQTNQYEQWKKYILKRLARENIIGNSMK